MTGKITMLTDKGFGYVKADGSGNEIYFHASNVSKRTSFMDLHVGDVIEFDVEESPNGKKAHNIQSLEQKLNTMTTTPLADAV